MTAGIRWAPSGYPAATGTALPRPADLARRRAIAGRLSPSRAAGYTRVTIAGRIRRMEASPNPMSGVPNGVPKPKNLRLEGKRMASGDTGNVVPGNRLWVRVPCPPLRRSVASACESRRRRRGPGDSASSRHDTALSGGRDDRPSRRPAGNSASRTCGWPLPLARRHTAGESAAATRSRRSTRSRASCSRK